MNIYRSTLITLFLLLSSLAARVFYLQGHFAARPTQHLLALISPLALILFFTVLLRVSDKLPAQLSAGSFGGIANPSTGFTKLSVGSSAIAVAVFFMVLFGAKGWAAIGAAALAVVLFYSLSAVAVLFSFVALWRHEKAFWPNFVCWLVAITFFPVFRYVASS